MKDKFTSHNIENDDLNLNNEESDYRNLIKRLNEIKRTITLLEKITFK